MKEKLSRFALSLMLALALYAAFLPTASADDYPGPRPTT